MERIIARGRPASAGSTSGVLADWTGKAPDPESIVVIDFVSTSTALCLTRARGVVVRGGGVASHGVRILREFGVPTITGVGSAQLPIGEKVTVVAERGLLLAGIAEPAQRVHTPSTRTKIFASIERRLNPELLARADGVASLRTNYLFLELGVHPRWFVEHGQHREMEDALFNYASSVAQLMHPKPVWYKLLDLPTDEYRGLHGGEHEPSEPNPILGYRGLYRELDDPDLLAVELRVLRRLHDHGFDNVLLKLPLVRREWEVRRFLDIIPSYNLEETCFGVGVETPSAVTALPAMLEMGARFASIGVNDLTTCLLGVDRNNELVSPLYSDTDPAILEAVSKVITMCREAGAESALVGWYSPELLTYAIEQGVDILSASQAEMHIVRKRAADAEMANSEN